MFNYWYTLLIVVGIGIDQFSKYIAQETLSFVSGNTIISNVLTFQLVYNQGAAYGILSGQRFLLLTISILVLVGIIYFRHSLARTPLSRIGLSFLVIGTVGNFIDRALHGYVIDFIYLPLLPIFNVFNIADISINIGMIALLYDVFFEKKDVI